MFGMTYAPHGYIFLIALPVSVTFLLVYFIYQVASQIIPFIYKGRIILVISLFHVVKPLVQTKRKEDEMTQVLVSKIISDAKSSPLGKFYKEDGTPDISAIKRMFRSLDVNKDGSVSLTELKKLMTHVNFVETSWNVEETLSCTSYSAKGVRIMILKIMTIIIVGIALLGYRILESDDVFRHYWTLRSR
nr:sodium/calcium exchanger NCL2-like [Tanacetum cinerariifolium]